MDNHTLKQRSFNMSRIKSSDTDTELRFRKYLRENGIRGYRIRNRIFGRPDLYFPKHKIAVFIDGCFWHKCPKDYIRPKSRNDYWDKKIENNVKRDAKVNSELKKLNIKVIRIWEHEILVSLEKTGKRIIRKINESN